MRHHFRDGTLVIAINANRLRQVSPVPRVGCDQRNFRRPKSKKRIGTSDAERSWQKQHVPPRSIDAQPAGSPASRHANDHQIRKRAVIQIGAAAPERLPIRESLRQRPNWPCRVKPKLVEIRRNNARRSAPRRQWMCSKPRNTVPITRTVCRQLDGRNAARARRRPRLDE